MFESMSWCDVVGADGDEGNDTAVVEREETDACTTSTGNDEGGEMGGSALVLTTSDDVFRFIEKRLISSQRFGLIWRAVDYGDFQRKTCAMPRKTFSVLMFCNKNKSLLEEIKKRGEFTHYIELPRTAPSCSSKKPRAAQILTHMIDLVMRSQAAFFKPSPGKRAEARVVVWDLDDTLIDKAGHPQIDGKLFSQFARYFDMHVLWSHGTREHVIKHMRHLNSIGVRMDYIIFRNGDEESTFKGIGEVLRRLNAVFRITRFESIILIDDLGLRNTCGQYDKVYITRVGELNCLLTHLIPRLMNQLRV